MKSTLTIITALLAQGRAWNGMIVLNMCDNRTVAFEVGMQNGGMATGLAFNVLHSPFAALALWWGPRSIAQDP